MITCAGGDGVELELGHSRLFSSSFFVSTSGFIAHSGMSITISLQAKTFLIFKPTPSAWQKKKNRECNNKVDIVLFFRRSTTIGPGWDSRPLTTRSTAFSCQDRRLLAYLFFKIFLLNEMLFFNNYV